jgi:hypothetical protein
LALLADQRGVQRAAALGVLREAGRARRPGQMVVTPVHEGKQGDGMWVPNWSSTAVTCDIGGSGSPTLFRAIPSKSVLVAASTKSKSTLSGISGAEHHDDPRPTATRHAGIHHGSAAVSRRPSVRFNALTCWFLDLAGQISVAGFVSRSST